ncbi:MAG: adenylosuccinate synthase [Methanomassiliicoccales archaeon]|nr:MAG: adenylosuccinate synthase [Methanomassiliicoccales archaeon]
MAGRIVLGTQFGDEGKGKITDYCAETANLIVRFQGGNNAGHTVKIGEEVYKFHLLPSGVLRREKLAVIGNGLVVDPTVLLKEVGELRNRGYEVDNLRISDRAHVIMPYHKIIDGLEEQLKGKMKAGTTMRGIGPCYTDKVGRWGIRIVDLIDRQVLKEKLDVIVPIKQRIIDAFGGSDRLDTEAIWEEYAGYGGEIKDFVVDASVLINDVLNKGEEVLFEGAQGTHLCIDFGIYPFGTSSDCTAGAALTGTGVGIGKIQDVVGVMKAYTSRVGTGPFPTELEDEIGEHLRDKGGEYGTTTGRPRRCGWLDSVMVRYSARINALTSLAVTKIDVLGGLDKIKVCTEYDFNGQILTEFPASMKVLSECKPRYKEFDGWEDHTDEEWTGIARHGYEALPEEMKTYLDFIEEEMGVPVGIISIGPARDQTITMD